MNSAPPIPTFSVVVTCYNYGQYLTRALDSVLEQTFDDFEVIVIDDGSTDNTESIIQPYLENTKVKYIRQENQGQPKAKNRGIQESTGEFVAFLDADDIWFPDKLTLQLELFQKSADTGVVYSRRKWIDANDKILDGNERILRRGKLLDYIFIDNFICFSSSVVRRDLLVLVGGFDEQLPMGIDYDLWIRLSNICQFDYVDEPLVKYRTGHANLSKNVIKRYDCAKKIMRKHLADKNIRQNMSWWVPRNAWSDTWKNIGDLERGRQQFGRAALCYGKSLLNVPFTFRSWYGLCLCILRRG